MNSLTDINEERMPRHIAIIMDGNGRWAKQRGKLRVFGHENGVKAVRQTVENCARLRVGYLTLYAFSTENWNRPKLEVDTLMRLLVTSLRKELKTLNENNIKLNAIGNIDSLPAKASQELKEVIAKTATNSGTTLTLALSYGAREELRSAVKAISTKVKNNIIPEESIDES